MADKPATKKPAFPGAAMPFGKGGPPAKEKAPAKGKKPAFPGAAMPFGKKKA